MGALGVFNTTEVMDMNDQKWTTVGDTDHAMNQALLSNADDSHLRRSAVLLHVGMHVIAN